MRNLIESNLLEGAAFRSFRFKDVNKLGGRTKYRRLSAPNDQMKAVHRELIDHIRTLTVNLSSATGARKHHSPVTNIRPHVPNRYFLLLDIKSAYETVDGNRLAEILYDLQPETDEKAEQDQIKQFLKQCCLDAKNGLLTGAPASPDLYNLYVATLLDHVLRDIAAQYGMVYTRYLDDLTFSSPSHIGCKKRKKIFTSIREKGFVIHQSKTQLLDRRRGPVKVTGLILTTDGRIILPRPYLNTIRGFLHSSIITKRLDQATYWQLNGMIAQLFLSMQLPRRPGQQRRLRQPNATEAKVLKLWGEYRRDYKSWRYVNNVVTAQAEAPAQASDESS